MTIGTVLPVSGCFTKEKFIAGRSLADIERILGFRAGRLSTGIAVVALLELPRLENFQLASYSNVATHRHQTPDGLDIEKIKANARATWDTIGFERLVKVLPMTRHDPLMHPDIQYPPGQGAPQWIATVPVMGKVVALVSGYPDGRYLVGAAGGA